MIGVGNRWRGDDGAGLAVARAVGGVEHEGDCASLIDTWADAPHAIVVDAVAAGGPPGTIHRFDASRGALPVGPLRTSSSHAFGVPEAVELARALDRLPARLEVIGVEGANFASGGDLSPAVERAVAELVAELRAST